MPEKYSLEEKEKIKALTRRMFNKCMERGLTYRQVGSLVKAQPSTVWRWYHGKSWPSRHHVHHVKKFLGYIGVK